MSLPVIAVGGAVALFVVVLVIYWFGKSRD